MLALRIKVSLSNVLIANDVASFDLDHCSTKADLTRGDERMQTMRSLIQKYLRDLVYGANDGIVTTLVVVSGVTGAALSSNVVLILGAANLLADGFSMGASNVLAERSTVSETTRPSIRQASRHGMATIVGFCTGWLYSALDLSVPVV